MKTLCFILLISAMIMTTAFGQIPNDKDILPWIGEGKGKTATDATGNGNDGIFDAGAKWVAGGKYGAGISLEAKGSYLEVPNVIKEEGSLVLWFKPNWDGSDKSDYRIFDASLGGIYFFIGKGSAHVDITPAEFGFYFEAADDADWQDVEFDPKGVIKKGKWFHVVATWDFSGGATPFLYIDGKELGTSPKKIEGGFPALNEKPRFGTETIKYIPITNGAEGIIDEIAFYAKVLEEKEIQGIMDASAPVEPSGKFTTTWGDIKYRY
ncbi:LamG domain-containing protein [Candidatus Poribacteria bacterium]|nr:LamG domain-containing protein [Candidatus Poribacteria bacterium]